MPDSTNRQSYHLELSAGSSGILADPIRIDGPFRAVASSGTIPTAERVAILIQTRGQQLVNAYSPSTVIIMSGDTWPTTLCVHSVYVPQLAATAGCVVSLVEGGQP